MSRVTILIIVAVFSFTEVITAQTGSTHVVSASDDARCELNNLYIDAIINEATKNEQVFIISRRSKNEMAGVNWARLRYAKAVVSQFKGFAKEKVTIAVGEVSKDKRGMLEFWVGSKLFLVSFISKNQQICLVVPDY